MKKVFLILLISLFRLPVVAQSDIRLNNYWVNPQYITPATIYDKYKAVLSIAARKQWVGIPGAPTTFFASGSTYIDNLHTQLGLIVVQDQIGYTSTTNINLTYAYAIAFQSEWQLHFGLGGNYQNLNYDWSKATYSENADQSFINRLNIQSSFNADIGLEITDKKFKIGAASQNVFSLFSNVGFQKPNTNFLYGRYRENSNNMINMGYGICGIQYSNLYQAELNVTGYFKMPKSSGLKEQPDLFDLGAFYRTQSESGLILGFDLSEAIHFSYSYDYHFGGISLGSYGTHEFIITYNMVREKLCHNCWY